MYIVHVLPLLPLSGTMVAQTAAAEVQYDEYGEKASADAVVRVHGVLKLGK